MDRRRFFREGLKELLRPMSRAVEPIHRVAKELSKFDSPAIPLPPYEPVPKAPYDPARDTNWLRPPGALAEDPFLETCSRCVKCADVCPVQCIKIDPDGTRAGGAPYIEIDAVPCALCTGLECMHHCPSGALVPTPLNEIDMGTACWHEQTCVRSQGEACTMCVDHCPVGSVALELIDNRIIVHEAGCVGCGVCQNNCPTDPKSITVTPRKLRDAVS